MIKVGLIGAGFMGMTHAACYEALMAEGGFSVTAVADLDEERAASAAAKFGAAIFNNGMELIEKGEVDMIDICLPTCFHTEHAIKAMEKGYNVFLEKPVCLTEEEAQRLLEARQRTGVKAMAGQCIRFWDEYAYLKKLLDDGVYGRLLHASFTRISPKPLWAWDQWILDQKRSGSAALDLHIHDVDYVRYLMGDPQKVKCEIARSRGANEHIFGIYRFDSAVVTIEGGWDYPPGFPFEMAYRGRFEKATITFSSARTPSVMIYGEDGSVSEAVIEKKFTSKSEGHGGNISSLGGYYKELKYFLECLNSGTEPDIAPLEEGIRSFLLVMREIELAGEKT